MIKEVAWSFLRRIARTSPLTAEQYFSNYPEVREQIGQRASADEHHLNDLRFLHQYVRKHRPRIILEIGCGDSTIVMAHAAKLNADAGQRPSRLFGVDGNREWLDELVSTFPVDLRPFVQISYAQATMQELDGQLCHSHDTLPDITPRLIYLDGPRCSDVQGSIRGLTFKRAESKNAHAISADILLYEWQLGRGAVIIVDGRSVNVRFLMANLRRQWQVKTNVPENRTIFTLIA